MRYYFDPVSTERVLALPGETKITVTEYGSSTGLPVIFCHGWPSSCTMAELTDEAARSLDLRIISPDRPGISGSPLQKDRRLMDWPPLLEALVDQLGIGRFRMLAISGGAPYAYATAWAMPDRVRAISIVSGVPPIFELTNYEDLLPLYRWMLALHRTQPWLLRICFRLARPFVSMRASVRLARRFLKVFLQPCDAESLRDSAAFNACFESQRRAWRRSAEGVMLDARIYAEPWGFRLEEIDAPVQLWHGRQDRSFSVRLAQNVARRLRHCTAHYVENAGHYSLPIRNMRRILEELIAV